MTNHIQNDFDKSLTEKSKIAKWINDRLPIIASLENTLFKHPYPKNLSYWWSFGSIAGIALVVQILSGLFLAMHYTPNTKMAFDSVEARYSMCTGAILGLQNHRLPNTMPCRPSLGDQLHCKL